MLVDIVINIVTYLIIGATILWPYMYCVYVHYNEEYKPSIFSISFWRPLKILVLLMVLLHIATMLVPSLLWAFGVNDYLNIPNERKISFAAGAAADAFIILPFWLACIPIFPHIVQRVHSPVFNEKYFFSENLYAYSGFIFCIFLIVLWWGLILNLA